MPLPKTKPRRSATASWLEVVWKAVHQLSVIYPEREHFHYYQDICSYIESHWERLARGKDRTSTWTNTVSSTITTHKKIFKPGPEHGYWGLRQHPNDETPVELLREIRSELDKEAAPAPPAAPTYRKKRKSGWSDPYKSKKRQQVVNTVADKTPARFVAPAEDNTSEEEKAEEEEFIDIEGVSEEESASEEETPDLDLLEFDIFKPSYQPEPESTFTAPLSPFSDPFSDSHSDLYSDSLSSSNGYGYYVYPSDVSAPMSLPPQAILDEDWLSSVLA